MQSLTESQEEMYQTLAVEAISFFENSFTLNEEFNELVNQAFSGLTTETSEINQTTPEPEEMDAVQDQTEEEEEVTQRSVKERRWIFEQTSKLQQQPREEKNDRQKLVEDKASVGEKRKYWQTLTTHVSPQPPIYPDDNDSGRWESKVGEKRKFWETLMYQETQEECRDIKVMAGAREYRTKSPSPMKDITYSTVAPLASPDLSSGRGSGNDSQPECDQRSTSTIADSPPLVSPESERNDAKSPAFEHISIENESIARVTPSDEEQRVSQFTLSGSTSTGYIYDEYDECIPDFAPSRCEADQRSLTKSFSISSQLGKVFGLRPEKAIATGQGMYTGKVNGSNVFYVDTEEAGSPGFLTIGIQGPVPGSVDMISQKSLGESTFEIRYRVNRPGYYVIFVRWSDCNIRDSPFVCQITDPSAML